MQNYFRTDIARAKGMGSAKSGAHHWVQQRLSAILLAILSLWLVFFIICASYHDFSGVISMLQKPYNIVPVGLFAVAGLYHAMLGMQVIIEDYIPCHTGRNTLIILLKIFCLITTVSFVVALFYIMIL